MLERKHYQIHIWKRCHLAYQTGISIYKICGSETEKPILPNRWQQGKLTEPVQWNGKWLSNGQCVHSLIHTGEALRKCVLKSYFHMSKIIFPEYLLCPCLSCHVKRNNKCPKSESGKLSCTQLHVRTMKKREWNTLQYTTPNMFPMKCEMGKRHDKEYSAQCKASLKPKVKPTKWGGTH